MKTPPKKLAVKFNHHQSDADWTTGAVKHRKCNRVTKSFGSTTANTMRTNCHKIKNERTTPRVNITANMSELSDILRGLLVVSLSSLPKAIYELLHKLNHWHTKKFWATRWRRAPQKHVVCPEGEGFGFTIANLSQNHTQFCLLRTKQRQKYQWVN